MKKLKKLLCLALIFVISCSIPAQTAAKKVTASAFKEGKENYPSVTAGTYRIAVEDIGCVKFKAKKAGTYKFTMQNDNGTTQLHAVSFWKNQPLSDLESHYKANESLSAKTSVKYKLKKGDTMYIAMEIYEFGMPSPGNLKFAIQKVK